MFIAHAEASTSSPSTLPVTILLVSIVVLIALGAGLVVLEKRYIIDENEETQEKKTL